MALELHLIKGDGLLQYRVLSRPSQVLLQVSDGFAEGQVLRKFDKPNQITAALTAVAVEEILAGIDIDRTKAGFPHAKGRVPQTPVAVRRGMVSSCGAANTPATKYA